MSSTTHVSRFRRAHRATVDRAIHHLEKLHRYAMIRRAARRMYCEISRAPGDSDMTSGRLIAVRGQASASGRLGYRLPPPRAAVPPTVTDHCWRLRLPPPSKV